MVASFSAVFVRRFWAKVRKGEWCWLWVGATQRRGYGHFTARNEHWVASRYSWTLAYGPIPDGMCVLHQCDTPACVRPDHLFLGTRLDNAVDRDRKGRGRPGGNGPTRQKLTATQVAEIRRRYATGEGCTSIAAGYPVSLSAIESIVYGRTWRQRAPKRIRKVWP